jgi:hypothetical protein
MVEVLKYFQNNICAGEHERLKQGKNSILKSGKPKKT